MKNLNYSEMVFYGCVAYLGGVFLFSLVDFNQFVSLLGMFFLLAVAGLLLMLARSSGAVAAVAAIGLGIEIKSITRYGLSAFLLSGVIFGLNILLVLALM